MSTQEYDSNFKAQLAQASKRAAENLATPPDETDPTREIRRKQANLCDAVMQRVVELEALENLNSFGAILAVTATVAKKLRAAVVANT